MITTVVDPRPSINVQVDGGPTVNVGATPTAPVMVVTAAGPQGPSGAAGGGSGGGGYTHVQGAPSTVWTIQHNLGYAVSPNVLDANGEVILGWKPSWSNENVLILIFSVPLAGTAHVS